MTVPCPDQVTVDEELDLVIAGKEAHGLCHSPVFRNYNSAAEVPGFDRRVGRRVPFRIPKPMSIPDVAGIGQRFTVGAGITPCQPTKKVSGIRVIEFRVGYVFLQRLVAKLATSFGFAPVRAGFGFGLPTFVTRVWRQDRRKSGLRFVDFAKPFLPKFRTKLALEQLRSRNHVGHSLRRINRMNNLSTAFQNANQRVVVFGRDCIELVIVAPRTGNGQPLKCLAQRINLIVDSVETDFRELHAVVMPQLAETPERCANDRLVDAEPSVNSRRFQQITSNMFSDKLVVRHIVIERSNQIVTIAPGITDLVIPFITMRLSESHNVHPVTRPVFTKMR